MHVTSSLNATPIGIRSVSQAFGKTQILSALSMDIAAGETVALLGDSGSGKTTLLRLIAGLSRPTAGAIHIGETCVADVDTGIFLPPERRGIGMVFQDYALWPHMNVARNVAFPLEMRGINRDEREKRTLEALDLVGLAPFADRQPGTLSGGQQQRVALARAIVARPSVILFDEPLSNLDRQLRENLVVDIAALIRSLGMTAVYVTHDHSEAFAIADRVAILRRGAVLQAASPEDLVAAPGSVAVAQFLKLGITLEARVEDGDIVLSGEHRIQPPTGFLNGSREGHLFVPRAALNPADRGNGNLKGIARHSAFRGDGYAVQLQLDSGPMLDLQSDTRIPTGEPMELAISWDRARWYPASSSAATH